jgi:hypothetical protein
MTTILPPGAARGAQQFAAHAVQAAVLAMICAAAAGGGGQPLLDGR